jgi:hypothetical protein
MTMLERGKKIVGWVLHGLIGALLIFAGAMKLLNLIPPEAVAEMAKQGLTGKLHLIGAGEAITAVALLIPRTMSLGLLLASGFWGGVICLHMTHDESYVGYAVALVLTWLGAYLRDRRTFASFSGPR